MATQIIKIADFENYDFKLLAICTFERDYKICFLLNRALGFNFQKLKDVELLNLRSRVPEYFSHFVYEDEDHGVTYEILQNRSNGTLFLKDASKADYLLKISGTHTLVDLSKILSQISSIPAVIKAYWIELSQVKHKSNLLL